MQFPGYIIDWITCILVSSHASSHIPDSLLLLYDHVMPYEPCKVWDH